MFLKCFRSGTQRGLLKSPSVVWSRIAGFGVSVVFPSLAVCVVETYLDFAVEFCCVAVFVTAQFFES